LRYCAAAVAAQPVDHLIDGVVGFAALPIPAANALSDGR
jgi:hypothetical protein